MLRSTDRIPLKDVSIEKETERKGDYKTEGWVGPGLSIPLNRLSEIQVRNGRRLERLRGRVGAEKINGEPTIDKNVKEVQTIYKVKDVKQKEQLMNFFRTIETVKTQQ